jgi:hypothetical protein
MHKAGALLMRHQAHGGLWHFPACSNSWRYILCTRRCCRQWFPNQQAVQAACQQSRMSSHLVHNKTQQQVQP